MPSAIAAHTDQPRLRTIPAVRFRNLWLDRIWLTLVALAFVIAVPIWSILMVERFGWRFVVGGLTLAVLWRYKERLFPKLLL